MAYTLTENDGVLTFSIDRPEVRNAVNHDVMDGLERFIGKLEEDPDVKWGVITSEGGKAFCSGGDLEEFHSFRTAEDARPMLTRMTRLLYRLAGVHVPVVALMDGAAVGGGCELAAACDFRLMRSDAKAGFIQGTLAITTGWGGASLLYEKDGNHSRTLQLLMGAGVHTAETLEGLGWVTEVYSGSKEAALDRFLKQYAAIAPGVLRAYKAVAVRKFESADLQGRMLAESEQCAVLWESEAHHEAVRRFREKKQPSED
ncbi:hypothetical protein NCCP2716_02010 [Sporosarcina sp. NCCP-2716]|uniref:enoyl-CoA hydratase/isomerase family protein n=1 Tax=Sporosarcina sp. NCCP-2716 TaxID=2943679 RepID=UPI00203B8E5B|nr:enoyl-CoA hydratase/isomerase family protein [Sporosarcina sp. NCCP-2716]GKV67703.1 hypothetical protein NCCP2716_02010 [Sporosarcina sp. NCCP-2716]